MNCGSFPKNLGRFAVAMAFLFIAPSMIIANEVVGTAIVAGRKVELLNDMRWRYSGSTETECRELSDFVDFCDQETSWTPTNSNNPDADAMFRHDDLNYAMVISEGFGSAQGLTSSLMRKIVLENVAMEMGVESSAIPVLRVENVSVNDRSGETIVYQGALDGLTIIFFNSVFISENSAIQAITYSIATEITDRLEDLHKDFLSNLTFKEPA